MYNFYFKDEMFVNVDRESREEVLKPVVANFHHLVLAELGQRRRAQGGTQYSTTDDITPEEAPQPLATGMYHPPKSAFTQG